MKTFLTAFLLFVISVGYSQNIKYDSIKKQYNYFNYTYKFIGYTKYINGTNHAYDHNNNEVTFRYLSHHMNTKDDGSDYTVGDAAKSVGIDLNPKPKTVYIEEYKMPEQKLQSVKWNPIFNRWDYTYY